MDLNPSMKVLYRTSHSYSWIVYKIYITEDSTFIFMRIAVSITFFLISKGSLLAFIAHMAEVPSKSAIAADSRVRWMSLHILWNAQSAVFSDRRDRWLNSENAVCMMHSQCISCHDQSVVRSFFAFRPLTWQKREDTIFSFSSRAGCTQPLRIWLSQFRAGDFGAG